MTSSGGRYLPGGVLVGAARSITCCLSLLSPCRWTSYLLADLTATVHRLEAGII